MEITIPANVQPHSKETSQNNRAGKQHQITSKTLHSDMGLNNKMEQGNIKALFPNLGKTVWKDGQLCEIIGCNNNQVQLRTLTEGGYKKVDVVFWSDSFLIPDEL